MAKYLKIILFYLAVCPWATFAQSVKYSQPGTRAYSDSLVVRIADLERSIKKMSPGAGMYAARRELEMTMFRQTYEDFVYNEYLDRAKLLIADRMERARLKNDKFLYDFYFAYDQRVDAAIKNQKIRYQQLFAKEKTFRKELDIYLAEPTTESLNRAKHIVSLALNYASENGLENTVEYLRRYEGFVDALIYDLQSDYDLRQLTSSEKAFAAVFSPLAGSDSLSDIEEAARLADYCFYYAKNSSSLVGPEFFQKQQILAASALSDFLDRQGRNADLAKLTNQAIEARKDTLNPTGVYKWNQNIIVISQFVPTSTSTNVRRGEAILDADRVLADYIRVNKLGRLRSGEKMGFTFLIPYFFDGQKSDFFYDIRRQQWQYMVCYTRIVSKFFTEEVRKFLPPMVCIDEESGP